MGRAPMVGAWRGVASKEPFLFLSVEAEELTQDGGLKALGDKSTLLAFWPLTSVRIHFCCSSLGDSVSVQVAWDESIHKELYRSQMKPYYCTVRRLEREAVTTGRQQSVLAKGLREREEFLSVFMILTVMVEMSKRVKLCPSNRQLSRLILPQQYCWDFHS